MRSIGGLYASFPRREAVEYVGCSRFPTINTIVAADATELAAALGATCRRGRRHRIMSCQFQKTRPVTWVLFTQSGIRLPDGSPTTVTSNTPWQRPTRGTSPGCSAWCTGAKRPCQNRGPHRRAGINSLTAHWDNGEAPRRRPWLATARLPSCRPERGGFHLDQLGDHDEALGRHDGTGCAPT